MCGIGGIINTNNSKIDPNIIENIKDSLEHRGPDNSSIKYINESNCFVHTRLSIIDLNDRSNQPFQNEDKRYTLVFNGEIYNHHELRKELDFTILFITHDLNLLLEFADRIAIMKDGEMIEMNTVEKIKKGGKHSYTKKLIGALPSASGPRQKNLLPKPKKLNFSKTLNFKMDKLKMLQKNQTLKSHILLDIQILMLKSCNLQN